MRQVSRAEPWSTLLFKASGKKKKQKKEIGWDRQEESQERVGSWRLREGSVSRRRE